MYKVILVPLDGSHRAESILPHVHDLADKFGAKIVLLQCVEPNVSIVTPYDMVPYYDPKEAERMLHEAKTYLAAKEGELKSMGLRVTTCVESGPTVNAILAVAEREHADLIAMASHGRTGLGRVFYGSVAAGVLHRADRPLLLVRAH